MLPKQIGALNLDIPNKTGAGGRGKGKESMVDADILEVSAS